MDHTNFSVNSELVFPYDGTLTPEEEKEVLQEIEALYLKEGEGSADE